jgi:molybdate transport system substrate-binding protein
MYPMRQTAILTILSFFASGILPVRADTITVSAAISMKESLQAVAKTYEAQTHNHVEFNFDASGKLAAQIKQGAPVDLFISADNEQMDNLVKAREIDTTTRRVVVENSLVLIAPTDEKDAPKDFADLALDRGKKIAIGQPQSVPAGRYAMQTLKSMKLDRIIAARLVYGESVRQVLTYVEQGEVWAGIVYATDAQVAGDKVKVIATADAVTHEKIEYPGAVVAGSAHVQTARAFLDDLASDPAKKIFTDKGFTLPKTPEAPAGVPPATRPTP